METSSTKLTNADEEPVAEPALAQAIKKSKKKKKPKKLTPKQKALVFIFLNFKKNCCKFPQTLF